ncbi:Lar family restriction alleviation protein [Chryseobacterium sp.]|uniref:Lar family restriction alleviation protein n=1 Tax=Chryseobacterium sp. TaxID=1871047 RepID=UPI00321B1E51
MAENNSSAPLLPCPFCGGAAAVQNESPADNSGGYFVECKSCGASTNLRYACGDEPVPLLVAQWNARAPQAVAAQAAPAAVAVTDAQIDAILDEPGGMIFYVSDQRQKQHLFARRVLALATPALPATEDSSAGDLAEVQASTLQEIAIEELYQLGYTVKDGRLVPPDHVGELIAVVHASACGCQEGTCETKANRACRMTAEIREQAQAEVQAEPVEWDGKLPESFQRALNEMRVHCKPHIVSGLEFEVRQVFEGMHTSLSTVRRMYWAASARLEAIDEAQPDPFTAPQAQPADALDAAFEAVRKRLCKLPRHSFHIDSRGNIRRVTDPSGNWVEFASAHALFDPVAVDAAMAAAQEGGNAPAGKDGAA